MRNTTFRSALIILMFLLTASAASALQPVEHEDAGVRGARRVLIVSEWSRYKERLIDYLIDQFDDGATYIAVRSFTVFGSLDATEWDAVIVINAGVGSVVREPVTQWLDQQKPNDDNIVVLTTQIVDWTPQIDVDSVTAASAFGNIASIGGELVQRARSFF